MAALSRALPTAARCDRPRGASESLSKEKTGGLAQGPEEKRGLAGRVSGLRATSRDAGWSIVILLPFQISAPRWGGVSHLGSYRTVDGSTSPVVARPLVAGPCL